MFFQAFCLLDQLIKLANITTHKNEVHLFYLYRKSKKMVVTLCIQCENAVHLNTVHNRLPWQAYAIPSHVWNPVYGFEQ